MVAVPQFVNVVNVNNNYFMGGPPGMGGAPMMMAQQPSSMDQFMYGINYQVAMATAGPCGGSVVDWARSLAAGQQQGGASGAGGGMELLVQLFTMLTQAVAAKVQQRRAEK
ncbi:hypothetical protein [Vampirovibrio chlorellavorus]|uniref:hypothetical protein n=1 Tax=Vampirovibrio chlorellavorus TaxID=758823 RepID=UPI0026EA23EB|nr:hypothetical protein [Vampirovibrio chlorellavorus]